MVHSDGNAGALTDAAKEGIEADYAGWRVWRSRDHLGRPAC